MAIEGYLFSEIGFESVLVEKITETLKRYPPSMAILNFSYDYLTTRLEFISKDFINGYLHYQQNYIDYMSQETSIASDGTPLANHFLVMIFKHL
jgi:hypothetical protein